MDESMSYNDFIDKYGSVLTREEYNAVEDSMLKPRKSFIFSDEEVAELDRRIVIKKIAENRVAFHKEQIYTELLELKGQNKITEDEFLTQRKILFGE